MKHCVSCGYPSNPDNLSNCYKCCAVLPVQRPIAPPDPPARQFLWARAIDTVTDVIMSLIIVIIIFAGAVIVCHFVFAYNMSGEVISPLPFGYPGGDVINIELVVNRLTGVICGWGMMFFGMLLGFAKAKLR